MERLVRGQLYSRKEIAALCGGGRLRDALPMREGRVLCACWRKEPRFNPGAPEENTIGPGEVQLAAETLARQGGAIPVFIQRRSKGWEYVGYFRCTGYETDAAFLREKERENPRRGPIVGVVYLEEVQSGATA